MVAIKEYIRESNKIEGVTEEKAVDEVYEAWGYIVEKDSLSHKTVQETHRIMFTDRRPEIAGEYRDCKVKIGGEIRDNHDMIREEMDELLKYRPKTAFEALTWHIQFEKIHPFADGNGRIGRLLYLWHCNYINEEPILWQVKNRQGYYSLFNIETSVLEDTIKKINTSSEEL